MISQRTAPRTKSDLARAIQALPNPKFTVHEVDSDVSYRQTIKELDTLKRKGNVSVIIIQGS